MDLIINLLCNQTWNAITIQFLILSDINTWRNETERYWRNEVQIVIDSINLDLSPIDLFVMPRFKLQVYKRWLSFLRHPITVNFRRKTIVDLLIVNFE